MGKGCSSKLKKCRGSFDGFHQDVRGLWALWRLRCSFVAGLGLFVLFFECGILGRTRRVRHFQWSSNSFSLHLRLDAQKHPPPTQQSGFPHHVVTCFSQLAHFQVPVAAIRFLNAAKLTVSEPCSFVDFPRQPFDGDICCDLQGRQE